MKQTEQFAQDAVLLLILAAASLFTSSFPYICMMLCGILMILLTIRSLTDEDNKLLLAIQILLSAAFAVLSGGIIPFLIFYECRTKKAIQIILPTASYIIIHIIDYEKTMSEILFGGLLLFIAATLVSVVEQLVTGYITAKNQIDHAVSVTAVNEMYQKKLNQELVMKNYLADKNARLEERETISRNIHNSVGHSITAAIMTLEAADMLFDTDPNKAREKINVANSRIHESLNSIRHAVRVLDNENELIPIDDFMNQITAVAKSFMADTTIKIRTDFSDMKPDLYIPHEHAEFLTGAVQELLTNGIRHGNADIFTVRLTADSGHIRLGISDNGSSDFSQENMHEKIQNGFGLKKLISYAERCGGSAVFENEGGFKSAITLPLYKEGGNE